MMGGELAVTELAARVDTMLLWLALILPVLAVFVLHKRPVVVGTLLAWGTLIVAGASLASRDPESRNGFTHFFDLVWIALGWIPAMIYSWLLYAIKSAALLILRR